MKKLLIATVVALASLAAVPALAVTHPSYCTGTDAYSLNYKAKFAYPTGSYWVNQINHYPAYYAANDAYYTLHYGC